MSKILWESEAKNGNNKPFFSVRQYGDYYIYGERGGKDSVAFILLDTKYNKIGLINEFKPPINNFLTTAFGGSLDKDIPLRDIVKEEVQEEAGYIVHEDRITYHGEVLVSTQMNQICHLYTVDITDYEAGERNLDESETSSTVEWVYPSELLHLKDWKAQVIYCKYLMKYIKGEETNE